MFSKVKKLLAVSLVASTALLASPDSSLEVTPEYSDYSVLKIGYQTYQMEIDNHKIADFFDVNDVFIGQKFTAFTGEEETSEMFVKWKVGFGFNNKDNQSDIFHASIDLGYSAMIDEEAEKLAYFLSFGIEYVNGDEDTTFYNSSIGLNYKLTNDFYVTPFVGILSDDKFDNLEGEIGAVLTYKLNEFSAVSIKGSNGKYQDVVSLAFSYVY